MSVARTYRYLDIVPKGRDEAGLPWGMAWVKIIPTTKGKIVESRRMRGHAVGLSLARFLFLAIVADSQANGRKSGHTNFVEKLLTSRNFTLLIWARFLLLFAGVASGRQTRSITNWSAS